jgi:hypothetical protein
MIVIAVISLALVRVVIAVISSVRIVIAVISSVRIVIAVISSVRIVIKSRIKNRKVTYEYWALRTFVFRCNVNLLIVLP